MNQINDNRIDQCLSDIQKYEKWGNLLAGQSWVHLFNSNAPVSDENEHSISYITFLKLLAILLLKIEDDLWLARRALAIHAINNTMD